MIVYDHCQGNLRKGYLKGYTHYDYLFNYIKCNCNRMHCFRICNFSRRESYTLRIFRMSGSMLVPYIYGIFFLDEHISALRTVGLIVIMLAIYIMNIDMKKMPTKNIFICAAVWLFWKSIKECTTSCGKQNSELNIVKDGCEKIKQVVTSSLTWKYRQYQPNMVWCWRYFHVNEEVCSDLAIGRVLLPNIFYTVDRNLSNRESHILQQQWMRE